MSATKDHLQQRVGQAIIKQLVDVCLEARSKAYCPYSNFQVGAALLTKSGKIYSGCNIESAAFGAGVCAERTAIGKAISEGDRDFDIIAVSSKSDQYCTPCGVCRQLIREFGLDIVIMLVLPDGSYDVTSISDLLPRSFGPEFLDA